MTANARLERRDELIPIVRDSLGIESLQFKTLLWVGGCILLVETVLIASMVLSDHSIGTDNVLKLIALALGLTCVALFGLGRLVEQLVNPLGKIIQVINAMAQGDYTNCVDSARKDEIGQLAEGLRGLATKAQSDRASNQAVIAERDTLRVLVENLPGLIYVKDTQSRFLVANPAVVRLLGGKVEADLLGKSDLDFFPRDLAMKHMMDEQAIIQSGQPLLDCVEPTVDSQGNKQWLSTTKIPFRDKASKVIGLVGIGRDITKEKQTEETLAEERLLLHALLDTVPDSIFFKDAESRFIRVSKAKAQKHGLSDPAQAIGKTDYDFFDEAMARETMAADREIMRMGKSVINEEQKQTVADGSIGWFSVTKMPLRDSTGNTIGTFGVSRDVSKQKQAELALGKERDALKETVAHLQHSSERVTASSAQILAASTQMASTTREQASAVNEVTSTVKEIKASAEQVAQRAQSVAEQASHAAAVAQKGIGAVGAATAGMEDIRAKVEAIAENILALSNQTQQIGEIIDTVTDIAGQSNILALNAAIEAAQAGEAGKGFRVVADEVRSLAEQSRQAAGQVKVILGDIQKATNQAVMATEQGTKGVQVGSEQVSRTAQTIAELAESVETSAQAAQQIVAGVEQQTIGLDQIVIGMNDINQAAQQSAAGAHQSQKAAQDLNDLAAQLKQVVAQYRM